MLRKDAKFRFGGCALADRFSSGERFYILLLFFFSFASVVFQVSITQEISSSVFSLRAGLHIIFGLVHIAYGLGMYLAYRLARDESPDRLLRYICISTGIAVLLSLAFCLRTNIRTGTISAFLPLTILAAAMALMLFGMVYSAILVYFHQKHRECVGIVLGIGLIGVALGFAIRSTLVVYLGNNLLLVVLALCLVFFGLGQRLSLIGLVAIGIAAAFPSLDTQLEKLRDTRGRFDVYSYQEYLPTSEAATFVPLLDAWSPYAKINIYSVPGTPRIGGVYNNYLTWIFDDRPDRKRELFYGFINKDDRVLCIAVGGGWPLLAIPVENRSNITAVELDPVVVKFFQENPQYNKGLFRDTRVIRGEGRAVLDSLHESFDVIVIDLPGSPAVAQEVPVQFEDYLLTREALSRAMDLLGDSGVLVAYLLSHQIGPAFATVEDAGLAHGVLMGMAMSPTSGGEKGGKGARNVLRPTVNNTFALYVSRDENRIKHILQGILTKESSLEVGVQTVPDPMRERILQGYSPTTDDQPYTQLRAYLDGRASRVRGKDYLGLVLKIAGAALVASLLLSTALILFAGKRGRRSGLVYFVATGVGFIMLQLYFYAKFRSFFGDPVNTTLMVTLLLFLSSSLGSMLANRVSRLSVHPVWTLALALTVLLLSNVGLNVLPFGMTNTFLRFLVALVVIGPVGFFAGTLFPLGLLRVDRLTLGLALALDAIGTLVGFLAFHGLAWFAGISYSFYPLLGAYAIAAALMAKKVWPKPT